MIFFRQENKLYPQEILESPLLLEITNNAA